MKRWRPARETEVGELVVAWLRDLKYSVYQEVHATNGDIVAVMDIGLSVPRTWAIECKRSLNWKVIDQAHYQMSFCGLASIAIPYCRIPDAARAACEHLGVGILLVCPDEIVEKLRPRRNNSIRHKALVLQWLHEKQQNYAPAGSGGGAGWTPFKDTCDLICGILRTENGMLLKDMVARLDKRHHYRSDSTAYRCLSAWLRQGVVHGVDGRIEDGKYRLYLREAKP